MSFRTYNPKTFAQEILFFPINNQLGLFLSVIFFSNIRLFYGIRIDNFFYGEEWTVEFRRHNVGLCSKAIRAYEDIFKLLLLKPPIVIEKKQELTTLSMLKILPLTTPTKNWMISSSLIVRIGVRIISYIYDILRVQGACVNTV